MRPIMTASAKLFMNNGSQAVRLPKDVRFEGTELRVSKVGDKVILEPLVRGRYRRCLGQDRRLEKRQRSISRKRPR
jgi:virulence-associated protein VagC